MSKFTFALGIALSLTLGAHIQAKAEEVQLVVESIDADLIEQLDLVEKACIGCTEEELQDAIMREYEFYMRGSAVDFVDQTSRRVIASWYGGGQKLAKHTANGEVFNPNALTAAMRSCPFGTKVKVTNPANGKSVIVRINDRGPAKWTGATIDLTRAAARKIGIGKGPVIIDKC